MKVDGIEVGNADAEALENFVDDPKLRGDFLPTDDDTTDDDTTDDDTTDDDTTDDDTTDDDTTDDDATDDDAKPAKKANSIRIPQSRINEITKQKKDAVKKVAEYERRFGKIDSAAPADTSDQVKTINDRLDALSTELTGALVDADSEKISKLRTEESKLNRDLTEIRISEATRTARDQAIEDTKFDSLVDRIEADYTQFDSSSDNFNEPLVRETLELSQDFMKAGRGRVEAMLKAFEYTRVKFQLDMPDLEADDEKPSLSGKKRTTNTTRNKKVATSQPARVDNKRAALDTEDDVDILNMSMEDYEKMDEKLKSKYRGDHLPSV